MRYLYIVLVILLTIESCTEGLIYADKLIPSNESESNDIQTYNWMSLIKNDVYIKDLSLVGTHDAGAYRFGGGITICQQDDIYIQLQNGVRYLDIRLNYVNGELIVYHGIVSQQLAFEDDILEQVFRFLEENPSETVLMVVKNENGEHQHKWEDLMLNIVNKYADRFEKFISLNTKLSEVRGKISLISRSGLDSKVATMRGIEYDNSVFGYLNDESMYFSDDFKVPNLFDSSINEKKNILYNAINKAQLSEFNNAWFIINCNGSSAFAYPENIAKKINPALSSYLDAEKDDIKRTGIMVIDFATSVEGKDLIYKTIAFSLLRYAIR